MKIKEILKDCSIYVLDDDLLNQEVISITADSRQVIPGSLFFAFKGEAEDGHHYLDDAIKKGASFLVIQDPQYLKQRNVSHGVSKDVRKTYENALKRFYRKSLEPLKLIGVTGTNGKTTTSLLIQRLLSRQKKTGLIGTLYADTLHQKIKLPNTTPGIGEISSLFHEMVKNQAKFCVMEVSSHALKQERLGEFQYDVRIFLNLTQDHLDYHGTMADYYESKKRLFTNHGSGGLSIINTDDPFGKKLFREISGRKISFGLNDDSDYHIQPIRIGVSGIEFELASGQGSWHVLSPLPCLFNAYNVTAAFIAVSELGIPSKEIVQVLRRFSGAPGRMERVPNKYGLSIFIDYAHTPDAFKNVLTGVRKHYSGNIISVFGCGGDRDRTKRPLMGKEASTHSDVVLITSDNPRTENPKQIIKDILQGIPKSDRDRKVQVILDRKEAIYQAFRIAKKGDLVLILGKGHEAYQIIGQNRKKFNDKEVATKALEVAYAHH